MRILRKYILTEIMGLFALSLTIITVLFMSNRIIQLTEWAINRGVGVVDIGRLMLYLLPGIMVIIIPIVTLFSILLAVGRLSGDNEITALKSAGISLYRLFPPALLFALFTSCLALFMSLVLVPRAARSTRELQYRIVRTRTESAVLTKTFLDLISNSTFYIRDRKPDGTLVGVMAVVEKWPENCTWKNRQSVFAARGRFVNNPALLTNELWLEDGVITQDDRVTGQEQFVSFTELRMKLELGSNRKVKDDEARAEMTLADMVAALAEPPPPKKVKRSPAGVPPTGAAPAGADEPEAAPDKSDADAVPAIAPAPPKKDKSDPCDDRKQKKEKKAKKAKKKGKANWKVAHRELAILFHERMAFPLGCLALCFWALPLGIQPPRAGRARAIVVSILLSGTFYYLMILAKFFALQGQVEPALALWAPDLVIMLTGVYMLRQKNNERPVLLISWLEDWVWYAVDRIKAELKKRRGG